MCAKKAPGLRAGPEQPAGRAAVFAFEPPAHTLAKSLGSRLHQHGEEAVPLFTGRRKRAAGQAAVSQPPQPGVRRAVYQHDSLSVPREWHCGQSPSGDSQMPKRCRCFHDVQEAAWSGHAAATPTPDTHTMQKAAPRVAPHRREGQPLEKQGCLSHFSVTPDVM